MIAEWMVYALVVGACVFVAARAAEQLMITWRGHTRWVWVAAVIIAVALPLLPSAPNSMVAEAPAAVASRESAAAPTIAMPTWTVNTPSAVSYEWWSMLWVLASVIVALRYAVATRHLRSTLRDARSATMAGASVLVIPDGSPVVVGALAPQIVVPAWLAEFDDTLQSLVIAHEDEHRRAGDVWLVHGLAVVLIALPWNIPLWLMGRRLRRAIELDCDARVLTRYPDVQRYGRVLLAVAQRRGLGTSLITPALAEPVSLTEERIVAFTTQRRLGRTTRAALVIVTVAAMTAACTAEQRIAPEVVEEMSPMTITAPPPRTADTSVVAVTPGTAAETKARLDSVRVQRARRDSVTRAVAARRSADPQRVAADTTLVLQEFQVDRPASPLPGSPGPFYPAEQKAGGVEGSVIARFVVRADGSLDLSSVNIVRATNDAFAEAVRAALPKMRFKAAESRGRTVAQMVQQAFEFQIR